MDYISTLTPSQQVFCARPIEDLRTLTDAEIQRSYGMTRADLQKDVSSYQQGCADAEEYARLDRAAEDMDPDFDHALITPDGYRKQSIPAKVRWAVFRKDAYRCVICGSDEDLTADHIHAEARGGKATFENLQTLCRRCNAKKGA
jgi:5-methylcytosine-specific restriction endonuclease McrA